MDAGVHTYIMSSFLHTVHKTTQGLSGSSRTTLISCALVSEQALVYHSNISKEIFKNKQFRGIVGNVNDNIWCKLYKTTTQFMQFAL